ncbi:hypothetical protein HYALB_00009917 [Hymenoscyphus albidus]|uniref:Uncharacterized protein n=1 Tax=Hymenoscyphus albidus TaxID=595503 RepID=A0A9N9LTU7_9HELO|nr:hypothetical protein HYALB_00009917 [Hymenoscyphus albidus]
MWSSNMISAGDSDTPHKSTRGNDTKGNLKRFGRSRNMKTTVAHVDGIDTFVISKADQTSNNVRYSPFSVFEVLYGPNNTSTKGLQGTKKQEMINFPTQNKAVCATKPICKEEKDEKKSVNIDSPSLSSYLDQREEIKESVFFVKTITAMMKRRCYV